jgi:hypothetical protein
MADDEAKGRLASDYQLLADDWPEDHRKHATSL